MLITHLTKSRIPTITVRDRLINIMPGTNTSTVIERRRANGNVTMKGRVATVREICSLETIEVTRLRIQIV